MKNIAIALLTVFATTQAHARSIKPYVEAKLDQYNIQPESSLSRDEIIGAKITVTTFGEKTITLHLDFKSNCPVGALCIAMMPPPLDITVPTTSVETGGCGETIYKGFQDLRPVDGLRQELTVVDNHANTCKYFVAIPMTEVTYARQSGRTNVPEVHRFAGELLH